MVDDDDENKNDKGFNSAADDGQRYPITINDSEH
jgi:hypothetical protein